MHDYLSAREAGYSLEEWNNLSMKEKLRAKYYYQAKQILQERERKEAEKHNRKLARYGKKPLRG